MDDSELYFMAKAHVRPAETARNNERKSEVLQQRETEIRSCASELISHIFSIFDINGENEDIEINGVDGSFWSGGESVSEQYLYPEDMKEKIEITKRWIRLETPANMKYHELAPYGDFQVMKRVLLGTHDFRFSSDNGETWSETDKAGSIEVVTSLFLDADSETAQDSLESGDVTDPFEEGPIFIERLDPQNRPVFENTADELHQIIRSKAIPHVIGPPVHSALLNSIGDSIDFLKSRL